MSNQNKLVVAVLVLLALLFTGAAVNDGGDGDVEEPGSLVEWFGERIGGPPDAEPADLTAPCLDGATFVVNSGTCTLKVAASDTGRRTVRLRTDSDVAVQAPAPGQDTLVRSDAKAGDTLDVTVDGAGADIDLICAGERTCVLTVVKKG